MLQTIMETYQQQSYPLHDARTLALVLRLSATTLHVMLETAQCQMSCQSIRRIHLT